MFARVFVFQHVFATVFVFAHVFAVDASTTITWLSFLTYNNACLHIVNVHNCLTRCTYLPYKGVATIMIIHVFMHRNMFMYISFSLCIICVPLAADK